MPIDPTLIAVLLGPGGVYLLVLARALGLAFAAPAWSTPALPWRFRLAFAGVLTIALAPAIGPTLPAPGSAITLGRLIVVEAAVGAGLGLAAALIVAAARQGGELVGGQAALSAAALFDPEAGDELTPLGHLYGLVALGVFLALDGPLNMAAALAESYRVIPPGGGAAAIDSATLAFGQVGRALELVLRAAAPAGAGLAAAGLALGLLGRAAPSLGLTGLALPARSALGLLLALLGLAALAATLAAAWSGWFDLARLGG